MSYGPADLMRAVLGSRAGSMLSLRAGADGDQESFREILDDLADGAGRGKRAPPPGGVQDATGPQQPGAKTAVWDGRNNRGQQVASGVYFYRMRASAFVSTRKMVLLK